MKDLDSNNDGEVDFTEFIILVGALTVACNDFFLEYNDKPEKKKWAPLLLKNIYIANLDAAGKEAGKKTPILFILPWSLVAHKHVATWAEIVGCWCICLQSISWNCIIAVILKKNSLSEQNSVNVNYLGFSFMILLQLKLFLPGNNKCQLDLCCCFFFNNGTRCAPGGSK